MAQISIPLEDIKNIRVHDGDESKKTTKTVIVELINGQWIYVDNEICIQVREPDLILSL